MTMMRPQLRAAFEDEYRRLYSRVIPGVEVEILSWVLLLSAPVPAETTAPQPAPEPHTPQPARSRPVLDSETGEFIEVAIYERRDLLPGAFIPGPAVIVEDETSTVTAVSSMRAIDALAISSSPVGEVLSRRGGVAVFVTLSDEQRRFVRLSATWPKANSGHVRCNI